MRHILLFAVTRKIAAKIYFSSELLIKNIVFSGFVVVVGCPARRPSLSLPRRRPRRRLRRGPVQSGKVKERKRVKKV